MGTTLSLGDRGSDVERLQRLLNVHLHLNPTLPVDGVFGAATYTATRVLQASAGLGIDGVVTAEVWKVLEKDNGLHQPADVPIPASFRDAPWLALRRKRVSGKFRVSGITRVFYSTMPPLLFGPLPMKRHGVPHSSTGAYYRPV